jgi:hypothetical protein
VSAQEEDEEEEEGEEEGEEETFIVDCLQHLQDNTN